LPGFGLRITATGARSWVVAMRKPGAKHPARVKIGEPPEMGLSEARDRARALMRDPGALAVRDKAKAERFGALADRFLAHGRTKRGRELRPATLREYRRALLGYAKPLHGLPVGEVRRADAAAVIRAAATNSGPTTAMRVRAAGSRFYSWLIANGHAEHNPFTGTEGFDVAKRSRVLGDSELATLWAETGQPGDFNFIVRLCLWTGCRRSEAGGMRWSELQGDVWTVPGERTKNHRALVLPLAPQTLAALAALPRFVGRDLVFGRGPTGFQAWSKSKERLDARLGFARGWDLHDLRRSFQTRLLALGISRDLGNRLLNHALSPIDEAYDLHDYLAEKRAALQNWADALENIATGGTAKVLPLPRPRRA
jgi:integrase